jgi:hypothetical protein
MDAQENGTTSLEDLARRLEALERENADLRGKVAALEGSEDRHGGVAAASGSEPSEKPEEDRISRRRLLSKAGAAAAGLVVAGSLTQRDIREARAASPAEEFVSSAAGIPALKGTHTAGGMGIYGTSEGSGEGQVGVVGEVFGSGEGVRGNSTGGRGVTGSSSSGYGGLFSGGKAQLKLVPEDRSGRPGGAHSKGEIYMDTNAALFVCVRSGTPGRWRKVSTSAV